MKEFFLTLLIMVAIATPIIVHPKHEAAVVSESQVVSFFLFIPAAIISVIGFVSGLALIGGSHKVFGIAYLLLSLVLPAGFGVTSALRTAKRSQEPAAIPVHNGPTEER